MEKYVINPSYFLKNDKKRVILGSKEDVDVSEFFSFIHPVNAQFLSFFNGKDSLRVVMRKISEHFGISIKDAEEISKKYLQNSKSFHIRHQDHCMRFPENILVTKDSVEKYDVYSIEDFGLVSDLDFKTERLSFPLYINFNMNMKCFTNCIYCYANRKMKIGKYLPLNRILEIIEEAKSNGVLEFEINGGEVFMHSHIKEVLIALVKNGYSGLVSTKIPISLDLVLFLKDAGIKTMQISLDSVRISTLKRMIGVEDDYMEKMKETIEHLNREKIEIRIHHILTSYNSDLNEFKEFVSFLSSYEYVKKIQISTAGYTLYPPRSDYDYCNIRTSEKYMNTLEEYINSIRDALPNINFSISASTEKKEFCDENKKEEFGNRTVCTGNLRSIVILPDGKVTICEELYDHPVFIIGDLNEHSIEEVWNSDAAKKLFYLQKEALPNDTACKGCSEFDFCRQDRGVCWKIILMAYGKDKWDYPDPRCPLSPPVYNEIWLA